MTGVMKQKVCMAAAICIAIAGTLLFSFQRAQEVEAKVGKTQQALAEEVFRFHVVADSDSREDQAIKQKVRDAVLEEMKDQMPESGIKSAGDTEKWAVSHLEELEETAKDVVREEGETYGASAEVVTCYFRINGTEIFCSRRADTGRSGSPWEQALAITGGVCCIRACALQILSVPW